MTLIFQSFIQSFAVFARMILPVIGVFFASIIFWLIANVLTLGVAGYVSGPVTAAFIALIGMRVALALNGHEARGDLKFLGLYGAAYGIVLMIGKGVLVIAANVIAVLVTEWNLSDFGSFRTLANAEQAVVTTFVVHAVSLKVVLSVIFLAAVPALMAVPMGAAAQNAGVGIADRGFFRGFGHRFLSVYLICLVTYVPQFVFGILSSLYSLLATLSLFASLFSGSFEMSDAQLSTMYKGFGALAALLWLNSWVWAASALAFLSFEEAAPKKTKVSTPVPDTEPEDLRALRKQRAKN